MTKRLTGTQNEARKKVRDYWKSKEFKKQQAREKKEAFLKAFGYKANPTNMRLPLEAIKQKIMTHAQQIIKHHKEKQQLIKELKSKGVVIPKGINSSSYAPASLRLVLTRLPRCQQILKEEKADIELNFNTILIMSKSEFRTYIRNKTTDNKLKKKDSPPTGQFSKKHGLTHTLVNRLRLLGLITAETVTIGGQKQYHINLDQFRQELREKAVPFLRDEVKGKTGHAIKMREALIEKLLAV